MYRKLLPIVAAFLILAVLFGSTPFTYAAASLTSRYTIGPQLVVTTIPQDDQKREKGIIILGLDAVHLTCTTDATKVTATVPLCGPQDLMSQHKLLVTYNGEPILWQVGTGSLNGVPIVTCNVLEKDKVNAIDDPKTTAKPQFTNEIQTKLVDVTANFICKARWKQYSLGWYESAGVLDVYYTGSADAHWIADHILVVEVIMQVGRSVVYGVDIQDICVLGWASGPVDATTPMPPYASKTKPDDTVHYIWENALGPYASCEDAALVERNVLGLPPAPLEV
jgi:hypothetical protein